MSVVSAYCWGMTTVVKHHTRPLTTAEIAALALSLAHLGAGPPGRHRQARPAARASSIWSSTTTSSPPRSRPSPSRCPPTSPPGRGSSPTPSPAGYDPPALPRRLRHVTARDVEPVTCLVHREYWYLVGVCRMRRAIRAFRFDRIIAVEPTLTPSRPHLADRFLPFQRRKRTHGRRLTFRSASPPEGGRDRPQRAGGLARRGGTGAEIGRCFDPSVPRVFGPMTARLAGMRLAGVRRGRWWCRWLRPAPWACAFGDALAPRRRVGLCGCGGSAGWAAGRARRRPDLGRGPPIGGRHVPGSGQGPPWGGTVQAASGISGGREAGGAARGAATARSGAGALSGHPPRPRGGGRLRQDHRHRYAFPTEREPFMLASVAKVDILLALLLRTQQEATPAGRLRARAGRTDDPLQRQRLRARALPDDRRPARALRGAGAARRAAHPAWTWHCLGGRRTATRRTRSWCWSGSPTPDGPVSARQPPLRARPDVAVAPAQAWGVGARGRARWRSRTAGCPPRRTTAGGPSTAWAGSPSAGTSC